jgi:hypothetical protein
MTRTLALSLLFVAATAHADRYEATLSLRPTGGLASIHEDGAPAAASVRTLGLAGGLAWGLRNWLDLGVDLAAVDAAQATFDDTTVKITGTPHTGQVTRQSRLALARVGATLRLGVGWVPTLYLGLGPALRSRSDATIVRDATGPIGLVPDNGQGGLSVDLATTLRLGLDLRLTRRWSVGLAAGVTHLLGVGAPSLDLVEGSLAVGYSWYPLW